MESGNVLDRHGGLLDIVKNHNYTGKYGWKRNRHMIKEQKDTLKQQ